MRCLCGAPAASIAARSALRHRRRPNTSSAAGFGSPSRLLSLSKPVALGNTRATFASTSPPPPTTKPYDVGLELEKAGGTIDESTPQTATGNIPPDNGQASPSGLFRLLTEEQRVLLEEQRNLVARVADVSSQVGGVDFRDSPGSGGLGALGDFLSSSAGRERSERSGGGGADVIDSTFTVVIAGEFNAGKSTLINALLGQKLLEAGALPTTDAVTVLAYDPTSAADSADSDPAAATTTPRPGVILYRHPSPLLRDLTLIDTPGTNAVHADHTARTTKLLPHADLILFVTSADRPFTDSERTLLRSVQSYRKNVVVVLNKMDVLEMEGGNHGRAEKDRVVAFVSDHASELLGARPVVLPVSARDALGVKLVHGPEGSGAGPGGWARTSTWERSNFAELERFLTTTLTDGAKVRSKMLNPVGVAERALDDCLDRLGRRRSELDVDVATLRLLEGQMGGWTVDVGKDLEAFRREVADAMRTEGERCREVVGRMGYFDQWMWTVFNKDGEEFRSEWTSAAGRGLPAATVAGEGAGSGVERKVLDLVRANADGVATRARAQGQAVIEYLGKRPAVTSQSLVGSVTAASRFDDTRRELSEKMSQSVRGTFAGYDPSAERDEAMQSLRGTVVASGALHAGALASCAMTALDVLDVTAGAASASMLALLGAVLVPYRNRQVTTTFEERWKDRGERLDSSLEVLCNKEMERIEKRIMDGISPYTRYVRTELDRTERLTGECEDLVDGTHNLRSRINKLSSNY